MSEYWISQEKKYCDLCKCWISANKASVGFHESGKKHQELVQERLKRIRKDATEEAKRSRQEENWFRQMEEKAMRDYRTKDLERDADMTAKVFNEQKAEKEEQREAAEKEAAFGRERAEIALRGGVDVDEHGQAVGFFPIPKLKPIQAPTGGTQFHKIMAKHWYEAKTEAGVTYYWHVETHKSRWDSPREGFVSIAEQEETNKKNELKARKKADASKKSQKIHGFQYMPSDEDRTFVSRSGIGPSRRPETRVGGGDQREPPRRYADQPSIVKQGPNVPGQEQWPNHPELKDAVDPYGSGWEQVAPPGTTDNVDFETPAQRVPVQSGVTMHDDRSKFKEKTSGSLGGATKTGPKITFRKRKADDGQNFRKPAEDDD